MDSEYYPHIAAFDPESVVDGYGVRAVIFLSGCSHHCPNCHNAYAQDPQYGVECTDEMIEDFATQIAQRPFLTGITLSGGDPFYDCNKTIHFLTQLKESLEEKDCKPLDIWVYTGYEFPHIARKRTSSRRLVEMADVIVDGRFVQDLADKRLAYRGSSNQKIIDVKKTLVNGSLTDVIEWKRPRKRKAK